MSPSDGSEGRLQALFLGALLCAVTAAAYWPIFHAGFIWDDDTFLTANNLIRSADGLRRFWFTRQAADYWPMTSTTLWLEWRLWGMHAAGYHVTNLVLHIVECMLLWRILDRLRMPGAYLAALLFAVHPVNVESVAWITQRKNLLAMLFFLLSILFFLRSEAALAARELTSSKRRQSASARFCCGLSLLAFTLGMLSKGSLAPLPLVLLGIVAWKRKLSMRDVARVLPFIVVAVVLTCVNIWFQRHGRVPAIRDAGVWERLLDAGNIVWFYIYKILLPINLLFFYPPWKVDVGDLAWWFGPLAAIGWTWFLWRRRVSRLRPLLFAWAYFCLMLVPVMGITDVYFMKFSLVADHYAHLALVGVVAVVAAGWASWQALSKSRLPLFAATAAVACMVFLTWRQCGMYLDSRTLYEATLVRNPNSFLARANLALILDDAGDLKGAVAQGNEAVRLMPGLPEAHYNLGQTLARAGHAPEAIVQYEDAIRLSPDYPEAHFNLGNALRGTGHVPEALEHYEEAVRLKPDFSDARTNLANLLEMTGRSSEAVAQYEAALRVDPSDAETRNDLGIALAKNDRLPEAIAQFEAAIRLKPGFPEAENNLGMALADSGRPEDSIRHFDEALRLKPDYAEARANRAAVLGALGRPAQAESPLK